MAVDNLSWFDSLGNRARNKLEVIESFHGALKEEHDHVTNTGSPEELLGLKNGVEQLRISLDNTQILGELLRMSFHGL